MIIHIICKGFKEKMMSLTMTPGFNEGDEVMTVYGEGFVEKKRKTDLVVKLNNWKLGSNIVNTIDTSLYGTETDWQQANCQYPCDTEEESTTVASYNSKLIPPTPGYYYNDGTAPAQLLNPEGTYNNTNTQKELISWPDHDQSNTIDHDYNIQPQNKMNDMIKTNEEIIDISQDVKNDKNFIKSLEFYTSQVSLSNWYDEIESNSCLGLL
jgi:hypothetical protein